MTAPVCQSCGMPLVKDEHFGTEQGGARSEDYCVYCYKDGAFIQPDETLEHMIETCIPFMEDMKPEEARALLQQQLPTVKRWRGR